jgi:hypothetical protein
MNAALPCASKHEACVSQKQRLLLFLRKCQLRAHPLQLTKIFLREFRTPNRGTCVPSVLKPDKQALPTENCHVKILRAKRLGLPVKK